jgi:hypothetical protein
MVGVRPAASREIGVAAVSICGDRSVVCEAHFKACKTGTSCVPATQWPRHGLLARAMIHSCEKHCPNCGAEYQIERVEGGTDAQATSASELR